jgi:hypothetical protein
VLLCKPAFGYLIKFLNFISSGLKERSPFDSPFTSTLRQAQDGAGLSAGDRAQDVAQDAAFGLMVH